MRNKKCVYAYPYCRVVWDLKVDLLVSHCPLPTKTSQLLSQSTGRSFCLCRALFHMFLISFVYVLFLTIFIVTILSIVSRSLIFLSHLTFTSSSVWVFSWMILSHLRTHIRWADLEMSICRRRVFAFWVAMVCGFLSAGFCGLSFVLFRQPTPIMRLKLISSHGVLL